MVPSDIQNIPGIGEVDFVGHSCELSSTASEPPDVGLLLGYELNKLPVLVAEKRQLLHFRRSYERFYVVDVVPSPLREVIDSVNQ